MSGRILRTPESQADLIEIWSYIADDKPAAATRMLLKIERVTQKLARNMHLGRERPELSQGLRSFPCRPYVIFYRATASGDIETVRVLHGARDIELTLDLRTGL